MEFTVTASQLRPLWPELALVVAALGAMGVHLFSRRNGARRAGLTSLGGILASLVLLIARPLAGKAPFFASLTFDPFSFFLKVIFLLAGAMTIVLAFRFFDRLSAESGEIYYLLLLAIVGMMVTASTLDLLTFYVAFELFAIVSYLLAGIFKPERRSAEAGIKYFVLGVLSSAILLLGIALIYGLTGETAFGRVAAKLSQADPHLTMLAGLVFFCGLFFKVAAVPFHMWTPDVYEGAPTPLVAFLSTAPKTAAFAVMIRVLFVVFPATLPRWTVIFSLIAAVTMCWGNLAALGQQNLKRMMAYSSIAHAGYMLIGLAAFGFQGGMAILFYLFVYLFMNTAAFALPLLVQRRDGFGEQVGDLAGLAGRAPLTAAAILVLLLSLTGIPPTAGFIGKYLLFSAAVNRGLYWLVVLGALNSVISLFYYFRIGRAIFMEKETGDTPPLPSVYIHATLGLSVAVILFFGLFPSRLTELASAVMLR